MINKIKINDSFYNVRLSKNEAFYKVYFKGFFSEINVLRDLEYECLKNLPNNNPKIGNNYLVSPMPGKVVQIFVKKNDIINKGETLIILDAMKMENILKTDSKVKVLEIYVKKGEAVSAEQNLIKLQQIK